MRAQIILDKFFDQLTDLEKDVLREIVKIYNWFRQWTDFITLNQSSEYLHNELTKLLPMLKKAHAELMNYEQE